MKKRFFYFLFLILICMCLFGCGKRKQETDEYEQIEEIVSNKHYVNADGKTCRITGANREYAHIKKDDPDFESEMDKVTTVVIPSEIDGYQVTEIASKVFFLDPYPDKTIKKIVVPEGVVELYEMAFWGCEAVEEIVLPESLIELGDAFASCENLKSIRIPSNVSVMHGADFFFKCDNLKAVYVTPGSYAEESLKDKITKIFLKDEGCWQYKKISDILCYTE